VSGGRDGSRGAPLVGREEFDRFCRQGRLAGTKGNRDAGALLKEHLERAGFTALEGPMFTFSRWRLPLIAAFAVAWAVLRRDPFFVVIFVLLAGIMFRVWQGVRAGTPASVYGVRRATGLPSAARDSADKGGNASGCEPSPTVILSAHYDSTSVPFPFRGSPVGSSLGMIAVMVAVNLLYQAVHPVAGLVGAAGVLGVLFFAVLGENSSPGADDNASGVFAVLECLRRLGHQDGVNIVPVFFNYEEQGLLGSRAWVRKHFGKKGTGLPGVEIDRTNAYVINFDCVGRGRRVFISGTRRLRERLLKTAAARALRASRTWLYPSDHLAFRSPRSGWKAVSFVRANRFWPLDLGWVHSKRDRPTEINLENLAELAGIVEEFVHELSAAGGQGRP